MSVLLRPGNGFEPNMERIPGVLAACPARELTPRRPSFGAALADLAASTPPPPASQSHSILQLNAPRRPRGARAAQVKVTP